MLTLSFSIGDIGVNETVPKAIICFIKFISLHIYYINFFCLLEQEELFFRMPNNNSNNVITRQRRGE